MKVGLRGVEEENGELPRLAPDDSAGGVINWFPVTFATTSSPADPRETPRDFYRTK